MKLCEFSNCKAIAFYTNTFNKPKFCKEHKGDCLRTRYAICVCGKSIPHFGLEDDKRPSCCKNCKTSEMINIKDKKCICGKARPNFGLENDKIATCCKKCKTDKMIDINKKKCICGKAKPSFGLISDKIATCCLKCKTDEMINIVSKKCICGKAIPTFGLENNKIATCCSKCKTDIMIDIKNKKCKCGNAVPCFGLENDKISTCCKECKTDEMINIKNKKCKCGSAEPCFGLETDKTPTCCSKCRTSEMYNIKNKKCKSNYLENGKKFTCSTLANKKYKSFCTRCYAHHFPNDPLTFQIRSKTKEIAVRDYINSQFEGFYHDIPLWIGNCKCTHRRRIDHRKLIGNTLLCIETDENQHKRYKKEDENARYNEMMYIHGGKFIFIRFNPDKYKENKVSKNPNISTRLIELEKEINKQINRIEKEENNELLEEVFMYYDKE